MNKLVFVCSPYRGDIALNVAKAKQYCREVIAEGDVPFAPHLFFPQMLDSDDQGIALGLAILARCDELRQCGDPTPGMAIEIAFAWEHGIPVVKRHGV